MKPTLQELHQAIPHRGSGAPVRARSHYKAILALLRERGSQGFSAQNSMHCHSYMDALHATAFQNCVGTVT
jgi:hypothetical protein